MVSGSCRIPHYEFHFFLSRGRRETTANGGRIITVEVCERMHMAPKRKQAKWENTKAKRENRKAFAPCLQ